MSAFANWNSGNSPQPDPTNHPLIQGPSPVFRNAKDARLASYGASPDTQHPRLCAAPECDRDSFKRGYCNKHYKRVYRYGDPHTTLRAPTESVTRDERIEWVKQYKLTQGCADCGYNSHHAALDFDHRPGTTKVRDIKSGKTFGWAALQEEVAKCDVVCANCHRVRTYDRIREVADVVVQ